MNKFILTYLGNTPHNMSPEEGKKHMQDYHNWLQNLGEAVVSPANPIKDTHVVKPNGEVTKGGDSTMSGYTIVQADTIEDAIAMAKNCPYVTVGGTIEVSQLIQMKGQ